VIMDVVWHSPINGQRPSASARISPSHPPHFLPSTGPWNPLSATSLLPSVGPPPLESGSTFLLPSVGPPPLESSSTFLLPGAGPPPEAASSTFLLPGPGPPPEASSSTFLLPGAGPPPEASGSTFLFTPSTFRTSLSPAYASTSVFLRTVAPSGGLKNSRTNIQWGPPPQRR